MNDKFKDPYESLPMSDLTRTQAFCGARDYLELKNLTPKRGIIQTTYNLLLHKLVHELRLRNITSYEQYDNYRTIVGELCDPSTIEFGRAIDAILLRVGQQLSPPSVCGSAAPLPDGKAIDGNVGGRIEKVRAEVKSKPNESRDTKGNAPTRSTGGRRSQTENKASSDK